MARLPPTWSTGDLREGRGGFGTGSLRAWEYLEATGLTFFFSSGWGNRYRPPRPAFPGALRGLVSP